MRNPESKRNREWQRSLNQSSPVISFFLYYSSRAKLDWGPPMRDSHWLARYVVHQSAPPFITDTWDTMLKNSRFITSFEHFLPSQSNEIFMLCYLLIEGCLQKTSLPSLKHWTVLVRLWWNIGLNSLTRYCQKFCFHQSLLQISFIFITIKFRFRKKS